ASSVAADWSAELRAGGGRLVGVDRSFDFARLEGSANAAWSWSDRRASLDVELQAGTLFGDIPRQELYLLGGRAQLPGYSHRAFGGDRYLATRLLGAADIVHPWLRARAFTGVGWTGTSESGRTAVEQWGAETSGGLRPVVGVGVGV